MGRGWGGPWCEELQLDGWPTPRQQRGRIDLAAGSKRVPCGPGVLAWGQGGSGNPWDVRTGNTPEQPLKVLLPEGLGIAGCQHCREFRWEMMGRA